MEKKEIRKKILEERKSLTDILCREMSQRIQNRLTSIQPYFNAQRIMVYVSFGKEVETWDLMRLMIEDDKKVYVPRITGSSLQAIKIDSPDQLIKGSSGLGVFEPNNSCRNAIVIDQIDLLIVPIVAFDEDGGRIGYGRGYYDRYLEGVDKGKIYGLAFDFQEVDVFEKKPDDIRISTIITESRLLIST